MKIVHVVGCRSWVVDRGLRVVVSVKLLFVNGQYCRSFPCFVADCNVEEMLSLAREYLTDLVTCQCERFLLSRRPLGVSSLELAEKYNMPCFRQKCLSILVEQFDTKNVVSVSAILSALSEADVSPEAKSSLYQNYAEKLLKQLLRIRECLEKWLEDSPDLAAHFPDKYFLGKYYKACVYTNRNVGILSEHQPGSIAQCGICSLYNLQKLMQRTLGKKVTKLHDQGEPQQFPGKEIK